ACRCVQTKRERLHSSRHYTYTTLFRSTFKVPIINSETAFLLQKINHHIFPDIDGLMKNIQLVTDHLKSVLASVVNEVEKHTLTRSEEHTSELQSGEKLECRLLLVRNN